MTDESKSRYSDPADGLTVSGLIAALQAIQEVHRDLNVEAGTTWGFDEYTVDLVTAVLLSSSDHAFVFAPYWADKTEPV